MSIAFSFTPSSSSHSSLPSTKSIPFSLSLFPSSLCLCFTHSPAFVCRIHCCANSYFLFYSSSYHKGGHGGSFGGHDDGHDGGDDGDPVRFGRGGDSENEWEGRFRRGRRELTKRRRCGGGGGNATKERVAIMVSR
ncbi:hypothetical protein RJT34_20604 [Clitoria ternatea]|uniref:Uncharacterized protein n=1 Tax=Clitoria ternatea TaxID=43366 RepID=A0AAN9ITS2_CLITE